MQILFKTTRVKHVRSVTYETMFHVGHGIRTLLKRTNSQEFYSIPAAIISNLRQPQYIFPNILTGKQPES
jgi:hypothetical protein